MLVTTSVLLCRTSGIPINTSRGRRVRVAEGVTRHFGNVCNGIFGVPSNFVPGGNTEIVDLRSPAEGVDGSSRGIGNYMRLLSAPRIVVGGFGETIASDRTGIHCTRNGSNMGGLVTVCDTIANLSCRRVRGSFSNGNCNSFGATMNRTIIRRLHPVHRHCRGLITSGTCLRDYCEGTSRVTLGVDDHAVNGIVGGVKFVWFGEGSTVAGVRDGTVSFVGGGVLLFLLKTMDVVTVIVETYKVSFRDSSFGDFLGP